MKDIYIKFSGSFNVGGESLDSEHKGWIELDSYQHLVRQPRTASPNGSGSFASGKTEHDDIVLTKEIDLSSPKLFEACSTGRVFDEVEIHFMRASGSERVKYMEVKLKGAFISSVAPSATNGNLAGETFSLYYNAIQISYTQQTKDGVTGGTVTSAFSLLNNTNTYTV